MQKYTMSISTLINARSLVNRVRSGMTNLRILDGTLSHGGSVAREDFALKHIPNAQFFDFDEVSDKNSIYDNMLPKPKHFSDYIGSLGISNSHHVVVYDNSPTHGIFSSPRVWWMFKVFGHNNISVLDGGLPYWEKQGYDISNSPSKPHPLDFKATFHPEMVKGFEEIIANLTSQDYQVVDARGPGRFNGEEAEPRDDLQPGHMPGAINIPFSSIVDPDTGLIKDKTGLLNMFQSKQIDLTKPLVSTCGSGITACCIMLAAHLCGKNIPVYDGSWNEYYLRASREQVVLGPYTPADAA